MKIINALLEIAEAERNHYEVWKGYTGKDAGPDWVKITLGKIISWILGDTFTIKFFESSEDFGIKGLQEIEKEIPEAFAIVQEEEEHENRLMAMVDEERLVLCQEKAQVKHKLFATYLLESVSSSV